MPAAQSRTTMPWAVTTVPGTTASVPDPSPMLCALQSGRSIPQASCTLGSSSTPNLVRMETLTGERPNAASVAESPAAPTARSTPVALLVAMRPPEWIKNLLVFAGLLFSGKLDESAQVLDATLTFAAFCAISSAGYLFNDLHDAPFDRQHPKKRNRPIASGILPASVAWPA